MKPNILHIIDSFEQGGTERQAIQLVRLLNESGRYRVHLACLQNRGPLRIEAERVSLGEIREYPLKSFYDRNFLAQLRQLIHFLKEHQIKLVHTHDFYTNIFGISAAAFGRVPARIASKRETDGFRTGMQQRAERGAYALAHAVVANAEAVRRQLIREGVPAKKIVTVHNAVDISRVTAHPGIRRHEALSILGLPAEPERRYVTIVANVQHIVKDHPTFLRAAARVHRVCPQTAFVIAGDGELIGNLRRLAAELGLERAVFFIGKCEQVAELLEVSEVCVLSSKAEGFSNSILEYMAAARPVVVTDVGGAREAVVDGETGYVVSAGDDEAMAARILALLSEPECARAMGQRGKVIIEERFSCEAQLEQFHALYDRLLARPLQTVEPAIESLRREGA